MKHIISIQDISGCDLAYQVVTIGKEIDERKANPDRTFLNYYISVLPSTAVSARNLTDLAYKIIDLHGEEELQVDKYVRDMLPKAKTELDFNPIGI